MPKKSPKNSPKDSPTYSTAAVQAVHEIQRLEGGLKNLKKRVSLGLDDVVDFIDAAVKGSSEKDLKARCKKLTNCLAVKKYCEDYLVYYEKFEEASLEMKG